MVPAVIIYLLGASLISSNVSAFSTNLSLGEALGLPKDKLEQLASRLQLDPDIGLNISQFLTKYNYPLESHEVTTDDGFILTLHRIPHGSGKNTSGPPILFAHCLACSGMDWVWQGPNTSLALLLADSGYDIWLANMRGTPPSVGHKSLSVSDAAFWDFSFHEKGFYDMASSVDYVLNVTKRSNLTYVGHSQGTTTGLVLTSTKPEYNQKINLMVLLSPISYCTHATSPLVKFIMDYLTVIKLALGTFNIHGFVSQGYINLLSEVICNEDSALQDFCVFVIGLFAGFDNEQLDRSKFPVFLTNTPSGLSIKEVEHFTQEIKSEAFRQFDYGAVANLVHYGTAEPPDYDISKVTVPLAIYYAKNDFLSAVEDVERLISQLERDTVDRYLIEYEKFNHLDFITAKDVKTLLYDRVIDVVKKEVPIS